MKAVNETRAEVESEFEGSEGKQAMRLWVVRDVAVRISLRRGVLWSASCSVRSASPTGKLEGRAWMLCNLAQMLASYGIDGKKYSYRRETS